MLSGEIISRNCTGSTSSLLMASRAKSSIDMALAFCEPAPDDVVAPPTNVEGAVNDSVELCREIWPLAGTRFNHAAA